ncbi:hypothetical protein FACS1894184_02920 [Clostridia bacterium]|nr:hypothetical protein FACS1894184_02920 [Clostridia bacterium]
MCMRIFRKEFRKAALSPAVVGFVVLCVGVNAIVALLDSNEPQRLLTVTVMPLLFAESGLIAMFISLLSAGYENAHDTEPLVYSSFVGRRVVWNNLTASITAGLAYYCLLSGYTLLLFLSKNDGVSLNTSYLIAAGALTVVFGMLGFAAGLFCRRMGGSCTAAASTICGLHALAVIEQLGPAINRAAKLTPFELWLHSELWFTHELDAILWPRFETLGLGWSFAALAVLIAAGYVIFKRRNLA